MDFRSLWARIATHFAPFFDRRAWTIIAICAAVVWAIDPVMLKTVVTWVVQAGVFCGLAVIASRYLFPQIDLAEHVAAARAGNVGSGLVVLTVGLVMASLFVMMGVFGRA